MTELEKAAEAREISICQYSTNNCLDTNDCHRCQWGVPSLDLRCSNNASFKLGAGWKAKQSPWIKTSERLPIPIIEMVDGEEYGSVFVIGRTSKHESPDLHSYYGYNGNYKWEDGRIPEYWMPIPELSK